ncbi:MAG: glycosyltransferase [Ignavibacteriales bacterium]|nr:glycosyltransferase [Ignavibacteriales bacterium]
MFEIVFTVAIAFYFIQTVVFLAAVRKKFPQRNEDSLPSVTVIVAARNEEQTILRCLEALNNLEYPEEMLEIILVDDSSTDRTAEIIDAFIAGKSAFKRISSPKAGSHLIGKTNAIVNAQKIAKGEIILTTDADCAVPPTWVKTLASYYTGNVAMVNGFTYQNYDRTFEGMQSLDFIFLLMVGAGTINLKIPVSCIGNNLSYTKKVYNEIGGYENMPFSITEDSQLLLAISKLKKYRIIFPLDKEALVASMACPDIKSLYLQKKRWSIGAFSVPWYSYIIMGSCWLTHACMVAAPFIFTPLLGVLIFLKVLVDFLALFLMTGTLGIKNILRFFPAFQLYYLSYVVFLPFILAFNRKVTWKGRKF